ncbi:synaptogyrin-3-like isoform X2 [Salvelinus fontinalis]|uniref:synaptogyrin-3-like isoform X2 n=1 Tax=Salvelinus fontinalis TaxID=8038 RepID=UPI002485E0F4|nr:synaptogyrin-3-like isoform X2 [Salvelinus fontinalis]
MEPVGSFLPGKSGSSHFDPVVFVKQPRTILRLLCWVFSMVVFSCIVNEGYMNIGSERLLCVFNKNADACNYGVTVGVVCFLGSVCFLVLDIYFPTIHSVRLRRRATLIDMVFSALSSFLWFVGFCFLANQWQQTTEEELPLAQGSDAARAAVAFCFFSILTWAGLTALALQTFINLFQNFSLFTDQLDDNAGYHDNARGTPVANGVTIVTTNPYQQAPPFSETLSLDPSALTPAPVF